MAHNLVLGESVAEIEIKKSKFICHLKQVSIKDQAEEYIREIKKIHHKATHNVFCYLIGQDYSIQKHSDDGEPQGTAGFPILCYLKKEEVYDICAVVTRYFGGIKLGASGLVRAYTDACKAGIDAAKLAVLRDFTLLDFELNYSLQASFEHKLKDYEFYEKDKIYSDAVYYKIYVDSKCSDEICNYLVELTKGSDIKLNKKSLKAYLSDGELMEKVNI